MKTSTRRIVSLILNAFIVVSTAYVYRDSTVEAWRFFTNLSNVLAALTSLIMVVFSAIQLNRERKGVTSEKPFWLSVVRMFAAVCMTLTFVIVVIFLSPMEVIHVRRQPAAFSPDGCRNHACCLGPCHAACEIEEKVF